MWRTEVLQGLRGMKFEDIYRRSQERRLSQAEAAEILGVSERTFRRWRGRLQGFQSLSSGRSGLGDLPYRAVGAQQLRKFHLLQVVADVAPGIGAGLLGDTFEQQPEDGERDVGVSAQ